MKNLIKTIFALTLGMVVCFSAYAKDPVQSTWTDTPCQIDGAAAEWQGEFATEDKVKVDYAFRNDAKYLYILFKFKDPKFLTSIQHTGMNIYLDNRGKKKKDYTINFLKKQVTADEYIAMLEEQRGPLSDAEKEKIRANQAYLYYAADVTNKKADKNAEAPTGAPVASYREARAQDGFVLEFAIPLERTADLAPGVGAEPGAAIKVGFEWGGWTEELKQKTMAQLVGRDTSARAGDMSSGVRDEMRDSRESSSIARLRRMAPKKYDFWVDVQLANQQQ